MNVKVREQADGKVAAMASNLTDEALCLAWMATEGKAVTQELAMVRGWITDELHKRLGDDLFDEWLIAVDDNGNGVNPLAYFEGNGAAKGYVGCWNCGQPSTHVLTREGSNTLHACDNCTRIDCAEAERLGWTISKKATVMTENQEPTMTEATTLPGDFEPVTFQDVREGDTLSFSRRDNGFGGSGDILRLTGTVIKATDKTVTVEITGHNPFAEDVFVGGKSRRLGRTARLRRANWHERDVHRTAKATRRPFNAENVQYVDEGNFVTAVWCSDPTIDPKTALDNILRSFAEEVPYEVVQIAEATRHYKHEGANFSGWIISRGNDYSTEPIAQKRDAIKELHGWVEGYFTR